MCRIAAPDVEIRPFDRMNVSHDITHLIIVAEIPCSLCDANHTTQKKSIFEEKKVWVWRPLVTDEWLFRDHLHRYDDRGVAAGRPIV